MFTFRTNRHLRQLKFQLGLQNSLTPDFENDERFLSSPERDDSVFRDELPALELHRDSESKSEQRPTESEFIQSREGV